MVSETNETLRYYEVDRLWTQPPIQFGLRGDPISTEGLHVHFETPYATIDVNLQISGRVEYGDSRSPRIDQSRFTTRAGDVEGYIDWKTLQFGGAVKGPSITADLGDGFQISTRSRAEFAGKPTSPLSYEYGIGSSGEIRAVGPLLGNDLTVKAYPAMTMRTVFHGGPTVATGLVVGVGVLGAATASQPEIILPMILGGTQLQPAYGY